ncbi:Acyl-CoA N-acyltransferase [Pseudocohnilembus persalinus]|uniref:Glucosamine 6-phosphate N-acetyltransferase n=1 Tax=Pseudocohnilembus persalinus TaxID=266149 RepID=A0A0V0QHN3_PSEPJ|nr:Acyl-CoA N-acyltransferase [Pseudocohnilembus persalinus]|eukprot:KRX01692.1 Acyl-CoA N-acyltransferase [Pseudocohnilembus persalinus]
MQNLQQVLQKHSTDEFGVRLLDKNDNTPDFFETYRSLTEAPQLTKKEFENIFEFQEEDKDIINYVQICILDKKNNMEIVGFGAVIMQTEIIGTRGYIENIVVNSKMQGKGLGRLIIECLNDISKNVCNANETILNCKDKNAKFYEKLGYKTDGHLLQMKL